MAVRGCGTRVAGGIYIVLKLGPGGRPVEDFLLIPPVKIDPEQLGLSPLGVQLLTDAAGVTHVLDWIGSKHYPNVADFIEETRRLGISRRVSKGLDFSRLSTASTLICVHARAWIEDFPAFASACRPWLKPCPKGDHDILPCVRAYWEDVRDAPIQGTQSDPRRVVRQMPSFSYVARRPPTWEGFQSDLRRGGGYAPAMFARFPIGEIVVINDPIGHTHDQATKAAGASGLPVELEDE